MINKVTSVEIPVEVNGPSEIVTRKGLKFRWGARKGYTIPPPNQPASNKPHAIGNYG